MRRLLATAPLAFALAACAMMTTEPEPQVPEGNWLLPGTTWKLVELDGAPYAARATATLNSDGTISGQAPCNSFSATYSGHWPDISFNNTASTKMACPDLDQETAFFAAMRKVNHAEMLTDSMLLTGPDNTSLRFVRS